MSKIRLVFLLIVLNNLNVFSQTPEIGTISFEYQNNVKANSYIGISFYAMDAYSKTIVIDLEIKKEKSKFEIPLEKYNEIRDGFLKLSSKDIIKTDNLFVMDAATISISYTNYVDTITYSTYALNKSDETSTRQNFLALVRKILEIVNVNIREIN